MSGYLQETAAMKGISLSEEMIADFRHYRQMLLQWNERMNLTAITEQREIDLKHFLDSLLVLKAVELPQGAALIDIGTGAGFPGIPLKIARPDLSLSLLDSLGKRVQFLEAVSEVLGQENAFYHARAEEAAHLAEHREQYDIVTARAVASLSVLSEYCLPFLRVGGRFLALKGPLPLDEVADAATALEILGGKLSYVYWEALPDAGTRSIVVIEKISQTPPKYPRKYAKMTKAPL